MIYRRLKTLQWILAGAITYCTMSRWNWPLEKWYMGSSTFFVHIWRFFEPFLFLAYPCSNCGNSWYSLAAWRETRITQKNIAQRPNTQNTFPIFLYMILFSSLNLILKENWMSDDVLSRKPRSKIQSLAILMKIFIDT